MGATFGILFGLLLIVAGIALVFLCGFDPLYSLAGVALIGAGAALVYKLRPAIGPVVEESAAPGERARQKPLSASEASESRINKRI